MKRFVETVLVLVTLPLWLPLLVVACAVAFLTQGWPVFHADERAGRAGRPFRCLKIRTMRPGTEDDAARLTRVGRVLRALSLDELPQLLHVLTGTMALVGPRPLPVRYLPRYSSEQARRHEVRPGLTGWAQVNGRNALDWDEKLRLDVWYVDHRSWRLDAKIWFLTVWRVLRRDGIAHAGSATMSEFHGTNMV